MRERSSPFDIVFGRPGLAATHFPRVAAALGEGAEPDRERFLQLGPVGELMAEIAPDSGEGAAQIGLLTFHSFHRWHQGGEDYEIDATALARVLRPEPIGEWQLQPPSPAGYLQLPSHELWVPGAAGQPAEPIDGFFWVAGEPDRNALELLLVLGLHERRPGMTVIELQSGPLPAAGHWGDMQARAEGEDFSNLLPGGEQLHNLSTGGEVLKLVSRVFRYLRQVG